MSSKTQSTKTNSTQSNPPKSNSPEPNSTKPNSTKPNSTKPNSTKPNSANPNSKDPTADLPHLAELRNLRIAIVCDWLTNVGGAEKVILRIHQLFPDAPIYTSQYRPKGIDWFKDADVRTGWLQHFPVKLRRVLGPLRQIYFSRLNLSDYDLVISVTGAEAKAVKAKNGTHLSYCHVPTQYYWQMYDEYIKNPGFGVLNPLIRFFFRLLVIPLRHADLRASKAPDHFITISEYAKEQIKKYYGRDATVIHPPVELDDFHLQGKQPPIRLKDDYELKNAYVITSRQVNWKHVDLAVRAAFLSQRHVLIIGEGPEHRQLVKMAKGSDLVQFLPLMKKDELAKYLNQARGFLFPSLEPFGIAPVEALAAGCPVVAYGEGGAKDYVEDGKNGVLFPEQTPISLAEGILELEKLRLNRKAISKTADAFSLARFDQELVDFISHFEDQDLHESILEIAEKKNSSKINQILERSQDSKSSEEPDQPDQSEDDTDKSSDESTDAKAKKTKSSADQQDSETSTPSEDTKIPSEKDQKETTAEPNETKTIKSHQSHSSRSKKTTKKDKKTKKSIKTSELKKTKKQLKTAKIVKKALQATKHSHRKKPKDTETTTKEGEEAKESPSKKSEPKKPTSKGPAPAKQIKEEPKQPTPIKPKKEKSSEKPTTPDKTSESTNHSTSNPPTSSRAFPKIGEDVERTRELVKKSEAAKETQRPAFPKIGEKS